MPASPGLAAVDVFTRGWGSKSVRGWRNARKADTGDRSGVGVGNSFISNAPQNRHHVVTSAIFERVRDTYVAST